MKIDDMNDAQKRRIIGIVSEQIFAAAEEALNDDNWDIQERYYNDHLDEDMRYFDLKLMLVDAALSLLAGEINAYVELPDGCQVRVHNEKGETPLSWASFSGDAGTGVSDNGFAFYHEADNPIDMNSLVRDILQAINEAYYQYTLLEDGQ